MVRRCASVPVLVSIFWVTLASPTAFADEPPKLDAALAEFFEAKVRPVLVAKCLACHGPDKQKAGLRLDTALAMEKGGDIGPVVMPGDPDNSPLVEVVLYDGDIKMPPEGKLDDDQIDALREWVRRGAAWPAGPHETADPGSVADKVAAGRDFWAFRPVADPVPPAVSETAWPASPLDRFVLEKLDAKGLKPAPEADRRTLIRRLSFDLTGLPPTPEEVAAFLGDDRPDAHARLVDRLLSSPHYGERWGRHWLDIARYGEDQAHSFQPRLYPQGWRYRDWLTNALNADLPYDQFLKQQIAADLIGDDADRLDRLPALGFFALGPVYYGDAKKFDQYDDRVDTLTRGVLGLTVACARCHDHKYDPITQKDYYALAQVVAGSEYQEVPLVPADVAKVYDDALAAIKAKDEAIAAEVGKASLRLKEGRIAEIAAYLRAAWPLRERPEGVPVPKASEVAAAEGLDAKRLERFAAFLKSNRTKDRPALARWYALASRADEPCPDELAIAAFEVQESVQAIRERQDGREKTGEVRKDNEITPAEKGLLGDLLAADGPLDTTKPKAKVEEEFDEGVRAKLAPLRADLERMKKEAPPKYPIAHALTEGKATAIKVLVRGNADSPGDDAPRRFVEVLGGGDLATGSGRRELAEAVASPSNPLTARVIVNRVWAQVFGKGLIGTPSNLGLLGERPSHPELLDWLASRFVESGWSLKSLHRLILNSATYRQSGRYDAIAFEADPENRLLWRMSRRRLEVEAWRDALLAASGRLDPSIGGVSRKLDDPANVRRTYYATISRHNLDPLLRLFDFPDPNITSGGRSQTTVPLQQLVVLNDVLMVDSAKALAARLNARNDLDDARRIDLAYEALFARPAADDEQALGLAYLSAADAPGDDEKLGRWERYAQALLGTNEFAYLD